MQLLRSLILKHWKGLCCQWFTTESHCQLPSSKGCQVSPWSWWLGHGLTTNLKEPSLIITLALALLASFYRVNLIAQLPTKMFDSRPMTHSKIHKWSQCMCNIFGAMELKKIGSVVLHCQNLYILVNSILQKRHTQKHM